MIICPRKGVHVRLFGRLNEYIFVFKCFMNSISFFYVQKEDWLHLYITLAENRYESWVRILVRLKLVILFILFYFLYFLKMKHSCEFYESSSFFLFYDYMENHISSQENVSKLQEIEVSIVFLNMKSGTKRRTCTPF